MNEDLNNIDPQGAPEINLVGNPYTNRPRDTTFDNTSMATSTTYPMLDVYNHYEQSAALEDMIYKHDLDVFRALETGDPMTMGELQLGVRNKLQELYAKQVGTDIGLVPNGNQIHGNVPPRKVTEPVELANDRVRDLDRLLFTTTIDHPKALGFGQFKEMVEKDNRYNFNKPQLAYMLATAHFDTQGTFLPQDEKDYFNGTLPDGSVGVPANMFLGYQGRGYSLGMQNADMYAKMGSLLGIDLQANPDLAKDPDVAYRIMTEGMVRGWFTGSKLTDHINESKVDFVGARQAVGGEHADEIAELAYQYLREL